MPILRVTKVKPMPGYRLKLHFDDDTSGVADLSALVGSFEPYAPLRDEAAFAAVTVEHGAVTWPEGLDIATETVYALAHGLPRPTTIDDADRNVLTMALRELRKLSGVNQEALAETLEVTQGAISKLEHGAAEARLNTLRRYLEALGWDLEVVARRGNVRVQLRGL